MSIAVYKLVLEGCNRCKGMKRLEKEVFEPRGIQVTEVNFDLLGGGSFLLGELEFLCTKHGISSVEFPFYIFSKDNAFPDYIAGEITTEKLLEKVLGVFNEPSD